MVHLRQPDHRCKFITFFLSGNPALLPSHAAVLLALIIISHPRRSLHYANEHWLTDNQPHPLFCLPATCTCCTKIPMPLFDESQKPFLLLLSAFDCICCR
jgi:hypothetical protein